MSWSATFLDWPVHFFRVKHSIWIICMHGRLERWGISLPVDAAAIWAEEHDGRSVITQYGNVCDDLNILRMTPSRLFISLWLYQPLTVTHFLLPSLFTPRACDCAFDGRRPLRILSSAALQGENKITDLPPPRSIPANSQAHQRQPPPLLVSELLVDTSTGLRSMPEWMGEDAGRRRTWGKEEGGGQM